MDVNHSSQRKLFNFINERVAADPNNAEHYAVRAVVTSLLGISLDDSVSDADKAINLEPDKAKWYAHRAECYRWWYVHQHDKQLSEKALADYSKAIELEPEQPEWLIERAKMQGDHNAALNDCARAIELEPDNANLYVERSNFYLKHKDYDSAISDCTRAVELEPDNANLYVERSNVYLKQKDYDSAIIDCARAIELEPDNANLYGKRSNVYLEQERYDSAINDLTKAIEIEPEPENAYLYIRRSDVYLKQKEYESALNDCNKAIELAPDKTIARAKLAGAWLLKEDYDRVIAECNKAITATPDTPDFYWIRAVAYKGVDSKHSPKKSGFEWFYWREPFQSTENFELAKSDLMQAFDLSRSSAVFYHLIFCLYNQKQYDEIIGLANEINGWKELDHYGDLCVSPDDYCHRDIYHSFAEDRVMMAIGTSFYEKGDYESAWSAIKPVWPYDHHNTEGDFVEKHIILNKLSEQQIETARIEERNRIIADLSHSIKNLIATVIDPLQHIKQTASLEPQIIDNAIRGASLIREIVNAMNLSFKGSIGDFQYDARHNVTGGAMTIAEMVLESLKHSGGNMFDGKYFEKFMRKYFPNREAYTAARADWDRATASNDLARVTAALNTHFLTPEIVLDGAEACRMGNEKGSAVKLLILFQEMIFNAVKYASFVSRAERFVQIRFGSEGADLTFTVENAFDPQVRVKTSGLGHVIIKNFALILGDEPRIHTGSNRYAVTVRFPDFWKGRKGA